MAERLNYFIDGQYSKKYTDENSGIHIYYLKGADFEEKGQCIHIISEIMKETDLELYYSPFEKELPCAIYLKDCNAFITADSIGERESCLNSHFYDIGRIILNNPLPINEIIGYTMNQSLTFMKKSRELIEIADILLKEYKKIGTSSLSSSKIELYAARKLSTMLPRLNKKGQSEQKSISALSSSGYRFTDFPSDYRIIILKDELIAASDVFIKKAASTATKLGYNTITAKAVDSTNAPLHLIIPEAKLAFISAGTIFPVNFANEKLNLNRYYSSKIIAVSEHYISFFKEFIIKTYKEAALYARICFDIKNQGRKILLPFVNPTPLSEISAEIIFDITNNS